MLRDSVTLDMKKTSFLVFGGPTNTEPSGGIYYWMSRARSDPGWANLSRMGVFLNATFLPKTRWAQLGTKKNHHTKNKSPAESQQNSSQDFTNPRFVQPHKRRWWYGDDFLHPTNQHINWSVTIHFGWKKPAMRRFFHQSFAGQTNDQNGMHDVTLISPSKHGNFKYPDP